MNTFPKRDLLICSYENNKKTLIETPVTSQMNAKISKQLAPFFFFA